MQAGISYPIRMSLPRHSREGGNLSSHTHLPLEEIPAFAGMTQRDMSKLKRSKDKNLSSGVKPRGLRDCHGRFAPSQ